MEFKPMEILTTLTALGFQETRMKILKAEPRMKRIFEAAYNPFKKYYMKAPGIIISNKEGEKIYQDNGELTLECVNLLHALSSRELSGNLAKEKVQDYIAGLTAESADLFQRILNKDLRCGINIKSIESVYPGLIPTNEGGIEKIPVMLLRTFNEKKANFPLLMAPKLDGVRGRFKNGNMYTRQGKVIKGLDHICDALTDLGDEFNDLDGELTVPGDLFDKASGLIRNDHPVPEAVYNIFDYPSYGFPKYHAIKKMRYVHLQDLFNRDLLPSCIKLIIHVFVKSMEEVERYHDMYLSAGFEGSVLYDPESLYEDKRSYDWMRLVPIKSADCPIIGYEIGKGKYSHTLGKIIIGFRGHRVKVGSGFTDALRDEIWNNKEKYLTKIVKVEYKERTKAGSMRQPRFKGFREDK